MVLSYYYLALVRKKLLQAHHGRCCSLVKLLCVYFCYLKSALILQKTCPNFGKNTLFVCIHRLNSHNALLRVSWRKNTKTFPCRTLLLHAVHETFSKCPYLQKPPLPQKIPGCAPVKQKQT